MERKDLDLANSFGFRLETTKEHRGKSYGHAGFLNGEKKFFREPKT